MTAVARKLNGRHFANALLATILIYMCRLPAGAGAFAASQAGYDCQTGCRKAFRPVCGVDGHTYSNPCVATCQGVQIASQGPCPDEPILHPANKHVVPGDDDAAGAIDDPTSTSTTTTTTSSSSSLLTPRHMGAFRREGYRYAGQVTFSPNIAFQRQATRRPPPPSSSPSSSSPSASSQPAGAASPEAAPQLRAVRITREGHIYVANLDESVDMVISTLIERHGNASTPATPAHVQSLLHSLRHWQGYRPRGAASYGNPNRNSNDNGNSKWGGKHVAVMAGEVFRPGEHALQPLLDADGLGVAPSAAAAGAVFAAPRRAAPAAADRRGEDDGARGRAEQPEREASGEDSRWWWRRWWRWLAGGKAADKGQRQRGGRGGGEGEEAGAGGGSSGGDSGAEAGEGHRPVRRSLGVFDVDERVDCPRTPTYPFTATGQINVKDTSGNYVCSGTLVGPNVVLTAAHCVYSRGAQGFYDELQFAPGRYRTPDGQVVNPFGVVEWQFVTVYQGYTSLSGGDVNTADIAVITLKSRIGSQAGWMGVFEPCSPYAPSRYVALTAGYPSDQPSGSCKTTQCVVVQEPCTDGYLYHKCDTAAGQSGSPLYMMAMTGSHKMGPYVRAVHNIEWVQEMPNGRKVAYINSAVSITPDHYRSILAWIGLYFSSEDDSPMIPALPPANYSNATSPGSAANVAYIAASGR